MAGELRLDDATVALFGLQLRRPEGWWVEVPGSARHHQGQILLRAPRAATVAVAWGRLGDARRRFPAARDHMEACLRRLGSLVDASRLVVLDRRPWEVGGHGGELASVEILPRGGWLGRAHHAMAAILHCEPRGRFYALYTHPYPFPGHQGVEEAFRGLLRGFRCH